MPLVRINLAAGKSTAYRQAIGDGVHAAMVATLKVPANDRFQLITEHSAETLIYDRNFLGVARSDDTVFIQIFLRQGRSVAMKQDFYRQVAANLAANPGLHVNDTVIVLTENDLPDWSFGQGRAQYVEQPPQNLAPVATTADKAAETTSVRTLLTAAGSLLAGAFVTVSLLTFAYVAAPDRFNHAVIDALPGDNPVALGALGA